MVRKHQVVRKILAGTADSKIRFDELRSLLVDTQSAAARLAGETIPGETSACRNRPL